MRDRTLIAVIDEDSSWLAAMGGTLLTTGYHALLIGDERTALAQLLSSDPTIAIVSSVKLAREIASVMGDEAPFLVLVTDDLDALSDEDAALFHAAHEKPASIDRVMVEVRRAVRGRRESGTVVQAQPAIVHAKKSG
jgi:DNA-binding NtrC family response regulator